MWSDAARQAALAARRAHAHAHPRPRGGYPNTHHVMKSTPGTHTTDRSRGYLDGREYVKPAPAQVPHISSYDRPTTARIIGGREPGTYTSKGELRPKTYSMTKDLR